MFRGRTVRTMFTAPAAALWAPPLFAPSPAFAAVHTARQVEAKGRRGATRSGERIREGAAADAVVPRAAYDQVSRASTARSSRTFQVLGH